MATVDDVMSTEVTTVHPQSSLRDALDVLRGEEITGAPVVLNGEVKGVVSITDILEYEATSSGVPARREGRTEWGELEPTDTWTEGEESPSAFFVDFWSDAGADVWTRFEQSDAPEWDELENHQVGEVMTRTVVAVEPGTPIRQAARLMMEADVQRILVMADRALEGIVTQTDIVRAVAEGTI